jgi:hypothetical protein
MAQLVTGRVWGTNLLCPLSFCHPILHCLCSQSYWQCPDSWLICTSE